MRLKMSQDLSWHLSLANYLLHGWFYPGASCPLIVRRFKEERKRFCVYVLFLNKGFGLLKEKGRRENCKIREKLIIVMLNDVDEENGEIKKDNSLWQRWNSQETIDVFRVIYHNGNPLTIIETHTNKQTNTPQNVHLNYHQKWFKE